MGCLLVDAGERDGDEPREDDSSAAQRFRMLEPVDAFVCGSERGRDHERAAEGAGDDAGDGQDNADDDFRHDALTP